jgi:tetratricopeptide (TPR) repeat protein
MATKDWFRNEEWNEEIETAFFAKLRRARDKAQYLHIQAGTLASTHPNIALGLLEQYFQLGDRFFRSPAHVTQAQAYLALGNVEYAIRAYEAALIAEEALPTVQTQAYLNLSFLVAMNGIEELYPRILELLVKFETRPAFPVEHFQWHASKALILNRQEKYGEARSSACEALIWAEKTDSGFRYHRHLGLVGERYEGLKAELSGLCNA